MRVQLQFTEHPGRTFHARLLETAHAVNPKTRTLLAQFVVENKNLELMPGAYTEVHFLMPSFPSTVQLPVNTLIFRKEGLQVASLGPDNSVVLKDITVERDFGNEVEVTSGIKPFEAIIINPSDSIFNGQKVRVSKSAVTTTGVAPSAP
jgi:multidrug efflux pump subunit AcrA (membrane-fusion protein)